MGKTTYKNGGRSKSTCTYDEGGGSNFGHYGACVLME